jgi:hypothetical protein
MLRLGMCACCSAIPEEAKAYVRGLLLDAANEERDAVRSAARPVHPALTPPHLNHRLPPAGAPVCQRHWPHRTVRRAPVLAHAGAVPCRGTHVPDLTWAATRPATHPSRVCISGPLGRTERQRAKAAPLPLVPLSCRKGYVPTRAPARSHWLHRDVDQVSRRAAMASRRLAPQRRVFAQVGPTPQFRSSSSPGHPNL